MIAMKKNNQGKSILNHILVFLNSHRILIYIIIFGGFLLFASIFNWSLLLGENLMKWDIWDAEYPSQLLVTDALANGTIMLWNPLMQYGTPYYAIVGTPIWYPITLLLAKIGYNPVVLSFSYVIHIAIGGFGVFLLGQQELQEQNGKWNSITLIASFIIGLIYCNSGLFMSNAEHIMIIISAAWIPYVFFFTRKYLENHSILFAMLAGVAAGMIFLGGYPELFYDTFLFLAPYTLYFQYEKAESVFRNILNAVKKYFVVAVFTGLYSAISLIPFLKVMGLLTRTNGLGQVPFDCGLVSLLSMLFSRQAHFALDSDSSMINFYLSILSILLIPMFLKVKSSNKIMYLGMGGIAFMMCLGSDLILHGLLYRFLPMYASFRFPSINRCILTMFLLLIVVNILGVIMRKQDITLPCKFSKNLFLSMILLAVISSLIGYWANESFFIDKTKLLAFSNSAWLTAIVVGVYVILFYMISFHIIEGRMLKVGIIIAVMIDLATFHHAEFPSTIASYSQIEYSHNKDVRDIVQGEFQKNNNRNKTINFSGSVRAYHQRDSHSVVFNKYLDEDGYVSILLQNIQQYKSTYLRSIMEQNPEAYFTNNVVSKENVDYERWVNSGGTPPEQIYIEDGEIQFDTEVCFEPSILSSEELAMSIDGDIVYIEGTISSGELKTGRIRLFYDSEIPEYKNLALYFYDSDGNCQQFEDQYKVKAVNNQCYIDVFLPNIDAVYTKVDVISPTIVPNSAALVYVERMPKDEYVNIDAFSFNDISMTVNAPTEGYVTILQAKYDGWKAYVDGVEVPITTVDNCFMGIKVSEGKHEITLQFRPIDFYIGATISCLFLVVLCCVIIRHCFLKKTIGKMD